VQSARQSDSAARARLLDRYLPLLRDAAAYAYSYTRDLSDLFLVSGLR
jgi:hypothetical protein